MMCRDIRCQVAGLEGIVLVACGFAHTVAVARNGACFAWGFGRYGATGSGSTEDAWKPVLIPVGGARIVTADAGYYHVAAVTDAGELYVWGAGDDGQLGTGDLQHRLSPTQVRLGTPSGAPPAVRQVACGMSHTVAVTDEGAMWYWGQGVEDLGLEKATPRCVWPVGGVKVESAACGFHHTLCVTVDGEVWSWGEGAMGRLGLGDEEPRQQPCLVGAALFRGINVVAVAAGSYHSAAICCDGSLWTWGGGSYCARRAMLHTSSGAFDKHVAYISRLAHSQNKNQLVPQQVCAVLLGHARAVSVAAGARHTLCVTEDGVLRCFGEAPHSVSPHHLDGAEVACSCEVPPHLAIAFAMATHRRLGDKCAPALSTMSCDMLHYLLMHVRIARARWVR